MAPNHRISIRDGYARELGRAAYAYAYLEWQVVCIGRKIQTGFDIAVRTKSGGQIAREFARLACGGAAEQAELAEIAEAFADIVDERNALMHATPITGTGGDQVLKYRSRSEWSEADIADLSEKLSELALRANTFFHTHFP